MENKMLLYISVLLLSFIQECAGYCSSYDSSCNDIQIWRIWYLWVIVIIVVSLCCGGCGAYRRRQLMAQHQQRTIIVGGAPVVAVHTPGGVQTQPNYAGAPMGQVNYGYNQGPTGPMAPPAYATAAGYPTPSSPPVAGLQPAYTTHSDPNASENKTAAPTEAPPAYTEAVKQTW